MLRRIYKFGHKRCHEITKFIHIGVFHSAAEGVAPTASIIKYAESPWKGAPLKARFYDLANALGDLGAWVRLHYVYPIPTSTARSS